MTRRATVAAILGVLAILGILAALNLTASPRTIERLHVLGWTLGLVDVLIVGASFLLESGGGH